MDIQESLKILKALSDSSRLIIINSLFEKPQYVEEIAQRLDLAISTVSHHLKKLVDAGLIEKRKDQRIRRALIDSGIMKRKNGIYKIVRKINHFGTATDNRIGKEQDRIMDKRKILKKEFIKKFNSPGIFIIKNIVNQKVFIGGSLNVNAFTKRHRAELKMGIHRNKELLKDYNHFGDENFTFDVLEYIDQNKDPMYNYKKDVAILLELWYEKLEPFGEKGYNKIPVQRN